MKAYGMQPSIITHYPSLYDSVKLAAKGSFGNAINGPAKQGRGGLYRRKIKNKNTFHNIRRVYKKHSRQEARSNINKELYEIW